MRLLRGRIYSLGNVSLLLRTKFDVKVMSRLEQKSDLNRIVYELHNTLTLVLKNGL